jgi:hypothetical protein
MKTITRSQIELAKPESEWVRYEDAAEQIKELKEVIKGLKNICTKCNKPVGNTVFTVCDDCWED